MASNIVSSWNRIQVLFGFLSWFKVVLWPTFACWFFFFFFLSPSLFYRPLSVAVNCHPRGRTYGNVTGNSRNQAVHVMPHDFRRFTNWLRQSGSTCTDLTFQAVRVMPKISVRHFTYCLNGRIISLGTMHWFYLEASVGNIDPRNKGTIFSDFTHTRARTHTGDRAHYTMSWTVNARCVPLEWPLRKSCWRPVSKSYLAVWDQVWNILRLVSNLVFWA